MNKSSLVTGEGDDKEGDERSNNEGNIIGTPDCQFNMLLFIASSDDHSVLVIVCVIVGLFFITTLVVIMLVIIIRFLQKRYLQLQDIMQKVEAGS